MFTSQFFVIRYINKDVASRIRIKFWLFLPLNFDIRYINKDAPAPNQLLSLRILTNMFSTSEVSVRCFKQIWKVGKVGKVDKVGKVGKVVRDNSLPEFTAV